MKGNHRVQQGLMLIAGIAITGCASVGVRPSSPDVSSPGGPVASSSPIISSPSQLLPVADANGDYGRTDHQTWQVIDPDPGGLNCRWSTAMPADWYAPNTRFLDQNFGQWQVVQQFSAGTSLTANLAPAGFAILYDDQQKPWLKVSTGENEQICLVRANSAYVQPIAE